MHGGRGGGGYASTVGRGESGWMRQGESVFIFVRAEQSSSSVEQRQEAGKTKGQPAGQWESGRSTNQDCLTCAGYSVLLFALPQSNGHIVDGNVPLETGASDPFKHDLKWSTRADVKEGLSPLGPLVSRLGPQHCIHGGDAPDPQQNIQGSYVFALHVVVKGHAVWDAARTLGAPDRGYIKKW